MVFTPDAAKNCNDRERRTGQDLSLISNPTGSSLARNRYGKRDVCICAEPSSVVHKTRSAFPHGDEALAFCICCVQDLTPIS